MEQWETKNRISAYLSPDNCYECWVKNLTDDILKYFSYFSQKLGFDILYKLFPKETICIKCQNLISEKNNKIQIGICWISPESGEGLKPLPLSKRVHYHTVFILNSCGATFNVFQYGVKFWGRCEVETLKKLCFVLFLWPYFAK